MKKRIVSLILMLCLLLSAVPMTGIVIGADATVEELDVTKTISWTPGADTAQVEIISNVPGKNETKVLFLGTLCSNHAMKSDTIKSSINAIAKNADVQYYLLNAGTTSVNGDYNGTVTRGNEMTKSYSVVAGGNHAALQGFINILYNELITKGNGYDSKNTGRYDYIVLEFDGTRIADGFSGKSTDSKTKALAEELKKYYAANKVIWITDGRVKTSSGWADSDGYTPSNLMMYGSDSRTKYISADVFRSLCALVAPAYYSAKTTVNEANYGNGSSEKKLSDYALTMVTRTGGNIDTSSYNAARQLTYKDADDLAEFLYMVIAGVTLDFADQIEFSDDISVTSVTISGTESTTLSSAAPWTLRGSLDVTSVTEDKLLTDDSSRKYATNGNSETEIKVTTGNTDTKLNNAVSIHATDIKSKVKYVKVVISLASTNKFADCITLVTDESGNPVLDAKGNFQYIMNPNNGPAQVSAYSGGKSVQGSAIAKGECPADAPAVNLRKISSTVENGTKSQTGGNIKKGEESNNPYIIYSADYKTVTASYSPDTGYVLDTINIDGTTYTADDFKTTKTLTGTGYTVTLNTNGSLDVVFASLTADHVVVTKFKSDATLSITGTTYSGVYDGSSHGDAANAIATFSDKTTTTEGITVTYSVDGGEWTSTVPKIKDVGSVNVKAKATKKDCEEVTCDYTLTVTPRPVTLTSATDSKTYDGQPLKNSTVTVTGDGFVTGEGASYDVTGSQTNVGNSTNSFTYTLDSNTKATNYTISTNEGTLTVNTSNSLTVTGENYEDYYDGALHGEAATPSVTEGTTVYYSVDNKQTWSTTVPQVKDFEDSVTVYVKAENSNYVTATCSYTLKVNPRPVTLTSATDSKVFDNTPLVNETVNVSGMGFVENEGVETDVDGSQTNVGSSTNVFTYSMCTGTKKTNYTFTKIEGTLTVTPANTLTVNTSSYEDYYDGDSHKTTATASVTEGTTIYYSVDGGDWTTTVPEIKDVDTVEVDVKAENSNYTTAYGSYTLKVNPRTVTLTSATDSKTYDGTPLINNNVTESGMGFVTDEGASYNVTGSQTDAGSSENTFSYTLDDDTKAINYVIDTQEGTLTVNPSNALTVSCDSYEGYYDGQTHKETATPSVTEGTTVYYSVDNGENWSTTVPEVKDVDSVSVKVEARNPNYVTATCEYTLKVNPKEVTLTSATDTKVYDKSPLVNKNVTAVGFVNGEGASYDVTGSQTNVGNSTNSFTYTLDSNTKATNYTISTYEGTLTVTPSNQLSVTGENYEDYYDGDSHGEEATPSDTEGTTVYYSIDNKQTWTTTAPQVKDVTDSVTVDVKAENPNYVTATCQYSLEVNPRTVTLTSATDSKVYDTIPLTNDNITVGDMGFVTGEGADYNVTGSQTNVGDSTNTFTYAVDSNTKETNYTITTYEGTLTVTPSNLLTVEGENYEDYYDGALHGEAATPSVTEGTTLYYSVDDKQTWLTTVPQVKDVEDSVTVYVKAENSNYVTATCSYTLKVNPRPVTLTSATDSKVFDNTPLVNETVNVSGMGFVENEDVETDVDGSQTNVGSSPNAFTYSMCTGTKKSNYAFTKIEGTLTVTPSNQLTVTGENYEGYYDASNHGTAATPSVTEGTTVYYSVDGGEWSATVPQIKNVGDVTVDVKAENSNYATAYCSYTLKVNPRPITFTSASDTKVYDTSPLTNSNVEVGGMGFAGTEGAEYDVKGSQTDVGSSANIFDINYAAGTLASNYDVTKTEGTLTVTPANTLTVSCDSYEDYYDGQSHKKTATASVTQGTTIYYSVDDGTNWSTTVPEIKDVDSVSVQIKAVNSNYATAYGSYTLKVNPRTVSLTSATDTKVYDTQPLTNDNITVGDMGFTLGEGASYDVKGTQTNVGSSTNNFEYTLDNNTKAKNYVVTTYEGTLTVTPSNSLTVNCDSYEDYYDGQSHKKIATPSVTEGTTVYYSVDGGDWTTTVPEIKDVGSVTVDVKAENSNYVTAYCSYTLTVNPRTVTLTSATDSKVYDTTPLTNSGVTVGDMGFVTGEGASYDVEGSQTNVGYSANNFTYTLNSNTKPTNYTISTYEGTLTVTPSNLLTVNGENYEDYYDGTSHKTVATPSVTEGTTVYYMVDGATSWTTTPPEIKDVGSVSVAVKAENPNYYNAYTSYTLTVNPRPVTLTSATDNKVYDKTPLTNSNVTVSGYGFVTGEGAAYDVTGSQTNVGASPNLFSYTLNQGTSESNYFITTYNGTLTVTPSNALTVQGTDYEDYYDAQSHKTVAQPSETDGTTVYYSVDGGEWTVTVPEIKDVGSKSVDVKAENPNYITATCDYTLKVNPRPVTLTSASDEKVYDTTPLTNDTVTVTGNGFAEGEGASYNVTGSQTDVGSSDNVFDYILNENTKSSNYEISTVDGTLKVTPSSALTVVCEDYEDDYDGEFHSTIAEPSVIEGTVVYYSVDDGETWTTTPPEIKNVGKITVKVKAENPNYITATYQYTLTVNKRAIVLTSESEEKVYDTKPLKNSNVAVTEGSFAEGEGATYNVTGEQTNVGNSPNNFTVIFNDGTDPDNYSVTKIIGTLTITPAELIIEADDLSAIYDGKPHGDIAKVNFPEDTVITYSIDGGKTWVTDFPQITEVGKIKVLVKAENPNYITSYGEYVIEVMPQDVQPQTGDNILFVLTVFAMSTTLLARLVLSIRRKKEDEEN